MKTGQQLNVPDQKGRQGVSLVEVVVAMCLLILSLTALLILFGNTSRGSENVRHHLLAIQTARTEIEQLHATPYAAITGFSATAITNCYLGRFQGTKECIVAETNSYKEITMIISWRGSAGNQVVSQVINTIISSTN